MRYGFFAIVVRSVCALVIISSVGGCGTSPIAPLGVTAHRGTVVEDGTEVMFGVRAGANTINVDSSKYTRTNVQPVLVYVEPSTVEQLGQQQNVIFSQDRMTDELTKATQESVTKFGRFERVNSPDRADIVVKTRLSGISAFGDWSRSDQEMQSAYKGWFGSQLSGSQIQDISREGIDILVSLTYRDKNGNDFYTERATGRVVSRKGEIIQRVSSDYGSYDSKTQGAGAKIDETRLPNVIAEAVDAAFAMSFKVVDAKLWSAQADATGIFAKNSAYGTGR